MGGNPSGSPSYRHTATPSHSYCRSSDMMLLICHVISEDHLIKEPFDFVHRSLYVWSPQALWHWLPNDFNLPSNFLRPHDQRVM